MAPSLMSHLGETYGPGSATGASPYFRIAYEWKFGNNSVHVGSAAFCARFNPAISNLSSDGSQGHGRYTDFFLDAGYQFVPGAGHYTASVDGFYMHENQHLEGTTVSSGSSQPDNTLEESRIAVSGFYDNTYGAAIAWDSLWGSANPALYQQGTPVFGSANGRPDSNSFILEADWIPFGKANSWWQPLANLKLGAQYTIYTQFDGRAHNYDGFGRNASDNNTLFLYAWVIF